MMSPQMGATPGRRLGGKRALLLAVLVVAVYLGSQTLEPSG
jgi:hypothetical protein